jgi:hypothetical protein
MISKIKNIVWAFLRIIKLGGPIQLMLTGALLEDGWYKSFNSKKSIDKNGDPIPWCTYAFIKFIEPRLKKTFDVFEYGCGNSSLWYSKKVKSIKSVENDKQWFNAILPKLPDNAIVVLKQQIEDGDYAKEVLNDMKNYHIIIIDGRDRNNCVKYSLQQLTKDGVIIYDNTQIDEFSSSIQLLLSSGFKKIDFIGNLPIVPHNNTTTIFYREDNCLLI